MKASGMMENSATSPDFRRSVRPERFSFQTKCFAPEVKRSPSSRREEGSDVLKGLQELPRHSRLQQLGKGSKALVGHVVCEGSRADATW